MQLATLHFKSAVIYLQGSGAAATLVTEAAEVSLDVDFDTDPDPAFGDTWETRLKGLMRFSGSIGGNFDTAQAANSLWEAAIATTSRKLYIYPTSATTTNYYYGNCFPKLGISGSTGGRGTFTASFEGDGQLAVGA